MTAFPLIGLTMNYDISGRYFSPLPWFALRENHCTTVEAAGGTPIGLSYISDIEAYIELLDGIIITGGDFDIHPKFYGEDIQSARVSTNTKRTEFELKLAKAALKRNIPILGICGGHQVINVAFGGSLIQHIPDEVETEIAHEQPNARTEPGHDVIIKDNTLLSAIVKSETVAVNSAHHQAIKTPGQGLVVNATAADGIIEGVEHPDYRFCMGVQWHPEFSITPKDDAITAALVGAAKEYKATKNV